MNGKTQIIQQKHQGQQDRQQQQGHQGQQGHQVIIDVVDPTLSALPSPPCYESTTLDALPPPSYNQAISRLYYKNHPYISDYDQVPHINEESIEADDDDSDFWAYIARMSLQQRIKYYFQSWVEVFYDGRIIFFSFFVLAAFAALGFIGTFLMAPSLFRHD